MPPRSANFVSLVEMGFLHVGQAVIELLTSGDQAALASQSAEITSMSPRPARPQIVYLFLLFFLEMESRSVAQAVV